MALTKDDITLKNFLDKMDNFNLTQYEKMVVASLLKIVDELAALRNKR